MVYEIRVAANKGLGLFAKHIIPCGTRILAEKPLIALHAGQRPSDVLNSAKQLNQKDRKRLLGLSWHHENGIKSLGRWSEALAWVLRHRRAALEQTDDSDIHGTHAVILTSMSGIITDLVEAFQILSIFRSNSFNLASSTKSSPVREQPLGVLSKRQQTPSDMMATKSNVNATVPLLSTASLYELALFPTIARINHSCIPNSQANYHPLHRTFNIHATRDISAGEEVSINYLPEVGQLRGQRISQLEEGYGFTCNCPACDLSTDSGMQGERNRKNLRDNIRGARLYFADETENMNAGYTSDGMMETFKCEVPDDIKVQMDILNRLSAQERQAWFRNCELDVHHSMLNMYRKERIVGREVASIYYHVARLEHGDNSPDAALTNARMGLRLEKDCLGTDHPEYQNAQAFIQELKQTIHHKLPSANSSDQGGL
jgi:hypothetical protein